MDAQLENELCYIIKIVFVISVRVNDWTAELAIIASNDCVEEWLERQFISRIIDSRDN